MSWTMHPANWAGAGAPCGFPETCTLPADCMMALKSILKRLVCCASAERQQEQARVIQAGPEPVAAEAAGPARPYEAFIENEARKYWQDMLESGRLNKPRREQLRTAAMPILCEARRRGMHRHSQDMAHCAVAALVHHVRKDWRTKQPVSDVYAFPGPTYISDLIRLADEADWLAREIPLPAHRDPQHPPIYYTTNHETGLPVPRIDSLLRGDYVYITEGLRLTDFNHIHPLYPSSFGLQDAASERDHSVWLVGYTLENIPGGPNIKVHWLEVTRHAVCRNCSPLTQLLFSPPPSTPG